MRKAGDLSLCVVSIIRPCMIGDVVTVSLLAAKARPAEKLPAKRSLSPTKTLTVMRSSPPMLHAPSLVALPDEVIIAILDSGLGLVPRHHQKGLVRVSLVCKHLHRIAQEVLLTRPYLRMNRITDLAQQYRKRPELAVKATQLELVVRYDRRSCFCGQLHFDLLDPIQILHELESLLALTPRLDTLLLGANEATELVPLQAWILGLTQFPCVRYGHDDIEIDYVALRTMRASPVLTTTLERLKVLGLPMDESWMRADLEPRGWTMLTGLKRCVSLKHLAITATAGNGNIPLLHTLPTSLERLVITTNNSDIACAYLLLDLKTTSSCRLSISAWQQQSQEAQPLPCSPELRQIDIWSRSRDPDPNISHPSIYPELAEKAQRAASLRTLLSTFGIQLNVYFDNDVAVDTLLWVQDDLGCPDVDYDEFLGLRARSYFKQEMSRFQERDRAEQLEIVESEQRDATKLME